MFKINTLTVKNFMSVGNQTQAVHLDRDDLTLVLGENHDIGSEGGARNGTGKCVCINTIVKVRNTVTGEIYETTVGDLYNAAMEQQSKR